MLLFPRRSLLNTRCRTLPLPSYTVQSACPESWETTTSTYYAPGSQSPAGRVAELSAFRRMASLDHTQSREPSQGALQKRAICSITQSSLHLGEQLRDHSPARGPVVSAESDTQWHRVERELCFCHLPGSPGCGPTRVTRSCSCHIAQRGTPVCASSRQGRTQREPPGL